MINTELSQELEQLNKASEALTEQLMELMHKASAESQTDNAGALMQLLLQEPIQQIVKFNQNIASIKIAYINKQ